MCNILFGKPSSDASPLSVERVLPAPRMTLQDTSAERHTKGNYDGWSDIPRVACLGGTPFTNLKGGR